MQERHAHVYLERVRAGCKTATDRSAAGVYPFHRGAGSRQLGPASGDDSTCRPYPQLRDPLRADSRGWRQHHMDNDPGSQHEAGDSSQQPAAGNDLHVPGASIRKARLLGLERFVHPDVHLTES